MVADLVADHIGPGELALGPEPRLQLIPEAEVQIDLMVGRAIERPHRRLARAAACAGGLIVEHHRLGRPVAHIVFRQDRTPDVGVGGFDHVDEPARLVADLAAHALHGGRLLHAVDDAHRGLRIDAEEEVADGRQHHRSDAAAGQADAADTAARTAAILDIALAASPTPFHAISLRLWRLRANLHEEGTPKQSVPGTCQRAGVMARN